MPYPAYWSNLTLALTNLFKPLNTPKRALYFWCAPAVNEPPQFVPLNLFICLQKPQELSELRQALLLSIPTVFDLIATALMNIGLLSVTASVYQMMRGAEMLFAALFAVLFLHRKLNKYHLSGIGLCTVRGALLGTTHVSPTMVVLAPWSPPPWSQKAFNRRQAQCNMESLSAAPILTCGQGYPGTWHVLPSELLRCRTSGLHGIAVYHDSG